MAKNNSSTSTLRQILDHPDREEILAKINIKIPHSDINEWLRAKYTLPTEKKYIISVQALKIFADDYLDIYDLVQKDLGKVRHSMQLPEQTQADLQLTLQNSKSYKNLLIQTAEQELDIRKTVKNLCMAIETRLAQVFDDIQEKYANDPQDIDIKVDRLLIEYTQVFGDILEKYYKFTEAPSSINSISIQNNISVQAIDEVASIFHDIIKEILSKIDLETSMHFMDMYAEKMKKVKMPEQLIIPTDVRLAEAQELNEQITEKLQN